MRTREPLKAVRLTRPILGLYHQQYDQDTPLVVVPVDEASLDVAPGADLVATHVVGTVTVQMEPDTPITDRQALAEFEAWYTADRAALLARIANRDKVSTEWRERHGCYCPERYVTAGDHAHGCQFATTR